MKLVPPLSAVAVALTLVACGGGDSSNSSSNQTPVLSGVVAVGAPLPEVRVLVVDANGVEVSAQTSVDGSYQVIEPAGVQLVPPFRISVRSQLGTSEVRLDSFALSRRTTANVTPLSSAVMSLLNASGGYDSASLNLSGISQARVSEVNSDLASALAPVLSAAGVLQSEFNPVSTAFVANNRGIDSVMDRVSIESSVSGVAISNRFVALTEGQPAPAPVIVSSSGVSGNLPLGIEPPSPEALNSFANNLKKCFSVPVASRVSFTSNEVGRKIFTPGTLHADCASFVDSGYLAQGQSFGQKWLYFLSSEDFDSSTKFVLVPQFVVDRRSVAWPGDGMAYVYNINLIDKNSLAYTMPEVLTKINDSFFMRGNQRRFDVSIQPQFTKLSDNAGTSNSIEGRVRIFIDPTLIPVDDNGIYSPSGGRGVYQTQGGEPLPKILCAWVTGPLLQKDELHDPNNPKGGLLMVPPHSDLTSRRDYSAVRIKYPLNFDPVNNLDHKNRLFQDCKATHDTGTNTGTGSREVASADTNNAFTIDAVRTNSSSTAPMAAYTEVRAPTAYPTSLTRTFCPTRTSADAPWTNGSAAGAPITTPDNISGWCFPTKRETMVSAAQRQLFEARYRDIKDLVYTFYIFVDANYSLVSPHIAYDSSLNSADFFSTAEVMQVRLVGRMAFLDKTISNGVEVYNGSESFRGVAPSMISTYLQASAPTLAAGSSIDAAWIVPEGSEGIDRLGIGGWFRSTDGRRIGSATFADSFGLPRSVLARRFTLGEDWYGFDPATFQSGRFSRLPYFATSTYREIWVRSYDQSNRQIQTVEFAVR
jgi:hypothetical protein